MEGTNIEGTNIEGANIEGANIEGANIEGANIEGANIEGANIEGANIEGTNIEGASDAHPHRPRGCARRLSDHASAGRGMLRARRVAVMRFPASRRPRVAAHGASRG
ncbi:pentapeptide repeat-containing protein [Burkholderia sp. ABCPW 14]|uniref:pentapeptide repeat-containing protein n=1 Tax=Burkholderia sp. ABCPW 14 TaxID=1637860 RepID=UPI0009EC975B